MARLLLIKPLEPLATPRSAISGPRRFAPSPVAFPVPQPTTVIGMIGQALGVRIDGGSLGRLDDIRSVAEAVRRKLKCDSPLILGPFVTPKDSPADLYVPVEPDTFVRASDIHRVLGVEEDGGVYRLGVRPDECMGGARCIQASVDVRVGASLERTGPGRDKTVRPGYMYEYPIVTYTDVAEEKTVDVQITYLVSCRGEMEEAVARLGGESRVVRVKLADHAGEAYARVSSPLSGLARGLYIAVSYIPVAPKLGSALYLSPDKLTGLEFIQMGRGEVVGSPRRGLTEPRVRVERLGLGYSESLGRRRPYVLALPPGTVVRLNEDVPRPNVDGVIKTLWDIGYATLFKLD